MKKEVYVGIDLATTNSAIAVWDADSKSPICIENRNGSILTKSAVCFHAADDIAVGDEAYDTALLYPERTALLFKRSMGKTKVAITVDGESYSPQQLSAFLLKRMIKDVEETLDVSVKNVIITVPADYGTNERAAVKEAGVLAGVEVIETLDEPIAIALQADAFSNMENQYFTVIDVGGGTTDIAVVSAERDIIKEEIIAGDLYLGGSDFDKAFVEYIHREYLASEVLDKEAEQELLLKAELAKQKLSDREETKFTVGTEMGRKVITVTRQEFEQCTEYLAQSFKKLLGNVKEKMAEKGITQLDKLILAGGSTRMPQIRGVIEEVFPGIKVVAKDVDQAVALGAALYAKALEDKKNINVVKGNTSREETGIKELKRVSGKTYGIAAYHNNELKIHNMLFQNEDLPARTEKVFFTKEDNQSNVSLDVYESTSMATREVLKEGKLIKNLVLKIKGNLPMGSPLTVEFQLNEDGTLYIKGYESSGNTEVEGYVNTEALLSEEELEDQKDQIEEMLLIV